MTFLLLGAFTAFFLLGWPVVLAVMIPAVVYVLWNGFPIELIGQRMAYALDSFPARRRAGVHLRRQPDEPGRASRR